MALQTLKGRSEAYEAKVTSSALWSPEMGNHMVEGVTKPPYQASLDEIDLVEESLAFRRRELMEVANGLGSERGWQGLVWTFANFPLLGTPGGQAPAQPASPKRSDGLGSRSRFVPDEVITPHPRFLAFVANIRTRKGAKTAALLPLATDASGTCEEAEEISEKLPWELEDGNRTGGFARRLASVRELYDRGWAASRRSWAEGYAPDACQLEVIEKLDNLSNSLSAKQVPKGLYLYGGVGTGKTMMLDLFHESLIAKGFNCDRQHFHGFLKEVDIIYHKMRQTQRGQSNLLARCAEDYFARCPILAFDEAHVLNIGDALLMKAFMEAYFRAGGVVVATSNVAPDDLYASGVNRETFMPFIDTLRQSCEFYEMRGREDYRMRESQTRRLRGSYLWGPNMASVEAADDVKPTDFPSLMETMNGSDLPRLAEALEIDVGFGRTLRCPSAWTDGTKTVARFTFDELCRRATGPSEWLGLAENVDAILVTGVPHFEAHDEDAARRFITFVDVAYDTKRFLGITAESSPEEIFGEFLTKYGGAAEREFSPAPVETETPAGGRIQMPAHGMASGRHGMIFQRPKSLSYTSSGGYVTEARAVASSVTSTQNEGGQRAGDGDWVEWSATGLKDASIFDLSPTGARSGRWTVDAQRLESAPDTDDPKAKRIYLDAAAFGAGSCCTQATMLCPSLSDARYLYDQLLVLAPLFLPLTASAPFWRGMVAASDTRMEAFRETWDDRTPAEVDAARPRTSRAATSPQVFLADRGPLLERVTEYNNVPLAMHEPSFH
ncbi:unnamed protein product, partial [Durusdinium trenchii]